MNRTSPYLNEPEASEPGAIESRIEQTRHRMDDTIEKISDKLDPRPYVDEAVDWVKQRGDSIDTDAIRDSISEAGHKTGEVIRENPLPLILGGLAIASAFLPSDLFRRRKHSPAPERASRTRPRPQSHEEIEQRHQPTPLATPTARQLPGGKVMAQRHHHRPGPSQEDNNGSTLREKTRAFSAGAAEKWNEASDAVSTHAHQAGEKLASATEHTQERLREASHQTADSLRQAAHSTSRTAQNLGRKTRDRLDTGRREHPLALCAGALAAGLVVALLIPRTRRENDLCGEEAEHFREELKSKGETMLDKSKQALADNDLDIEGLQSRAEDALESASETAREKIDQKVEPG